MICVSTTSILLLFSAVERGIQSLRLYMCAVFFYLLLVRHGHIESYKLNLYTRYCTFDCLSKLEMKGKTRIKLRLDAFVSTGFKLSIRCTLILYTVQQTQSIEYLSILKFLKFRKLKKIKL